MGLKDEIIYNIGHNGLHFYIMKNKFFVNVDKVKKLGTVKDVVKRKQKKLEEKYAFLGLDIETTTIDRNNQRKHAMVPYLISFYFQWQDRKEYKSFYIQN